LIAFEDNTITIKVLIKLQPLSHGLAEGLFKCQKPGEQHNKLCSNLTFKQLNKKKMV